LHIFRVVRSLYTAVAKVPDLKRPLGSNRPKAFSFAAKSVYDPLVIDKFVLFVRGCCLRTTVLKTSPGGEHIAVQDHTVLRKNHSNDSSFMIQTARDRGSEDLSALAAFQVACAEDDCLQQQEPMQQASAAT
jgi:hypothetical protein